MIYSAVARKNLWLRQSVHGWVLFLGIKSVYTTKVNEITEASASVGLLLATAVIYMLFPGWEVRQTGKNCARGFEYGPSAASVRT